MNNFAQVEESNIQNGEEFMFEVDRLEELNDLKNQNERKRLNYYVIQYVTGGKWTQKIDFDTYHISHNEIFVIPTGAIVESNNTKGINGYGIKFSEDFFSDVQKELLNGFIIYSTVYRKLKLTIPQYGIATIKHYFELLLLEQSQDERMNKVFILQNLMLALLNHLEGLLKINVKSFIWERSPFQKFINAVEVHYKSHLKINDYAHLLNISPRALNEIIKKNIGVTASNYIINRILLQGKREVSFTSKTIKEIAKELGYDDQYYFSRLFRKKLGLSPEQFRASLQYTL